MENLLRALEHGLRHAGELGDVDAIAPVGRPGHDLVQEDHGAGVVALSVLGMIPAESVGALIGLRLVAGIGEAMFFVGAVTIINDIAVPERRGEAVSLFSVSPYLGIALGPLLGETVLERVSFDAVWALAAGLSAIAVVFGLAARDDFTPAPVERMPGVRMRVLHPAGVMPGLIMLTSVWGFAGYMAFIRLYAEDLGMRGAAGVLVMYGAIMVAIRLFGARIPDVLGVERAGVSLSNGDSPTGSIGDVSFTFEPSVGPDGSPTTVRGAPFAFAPEYRVGKAPTRSSVFGLDFDGVYGEAASYEWSSEPVAGAPKGRG
jgi:MFS family permease